MKLPEELKNESLAIWKHLIDIQAENIVHLRGISPYGADYEKILNAMIVIEHWKRELLYTLEISTDYWGNDTSDRCIEKEDEPPHPIEETEDKSEKEDKPKRKRAAKKKEETPVEDAPAEETPEINPETSNDDPITVEVGAEATTPELTYIDIRAKFAEASAAGHRKLVHKVIDMFVPDEKARDDGKKMLSAVAEEDYPAMLEKFEELLAEESEEL